MLQRLFSLGLSLAILTTPMVCCCTIAPLVAKIGGLTGATVATSTKCSSHHCCQPSPRKEQKESKSPNAPCPCKRQLVESTEFVNADVLAVPLDANARLDGIPCTINPTSFRPISSATPYHSASFPRLSGVQILRALSILRC